MNASSPIQKDAIVRYQNGYRRVTAIIGKKNPKVNLGPVFGGRNGHSGIVKGISISEVVEAGEDFHASWSKSESYQSM